MIKGQKKSGGFGSFSLFRQVSAAALGWTVEFG